MQATNRYPLHAHTMASPVPVFPLVSSTTVWAGFQKSRSLRLLDHRQRYAILFAEPRVQVLELRIDVAFDPKGTRYPGEMHHRGFAYDLVNRIQHFSQVAFLPVFPAGVSFNLQLASQLEEVSTPRAFLAIFPMIFLSDFSHIAVIVPDILLPEPFFFIPRFFMPASC